MDDYDFSDYGGDYYFDPEAGGSGNNDFYSYDYQPSDLSWEDYLGSEQGFAPLSANFSDMSGYYPGYELMQDLGYQYTPTDDIGSYLTQNPLNDLSANLGSEIGDASTADLIKASLTQQPGAGSIGEEQDMVNRGEAIDMMEAQQKLSQLANPMEGFKRDVWSGQDMSQPKADPRTMGMAIDPWTGKPVDSAGMAGITAFDPTYGNDITDLGFLDENTARLYGLDQSLATGTGGWGGATGTGKGFNRAMPSGGSLAQLARDANTTGASKAAAKAASEAYQKENPTQKELTTAEKVKTGLGVADMAALAAALLGGGNKKGPKSLQGDINANAWEVARMKNRGQAAPRYAEGGLASIKEALQKMAGMKGKPAAVVKKEEYIVPPTTEDIRDIATQGSGMYQNAARALTGRQRQLELLEQEAMGKAMGGVVMPQAVMPNLIRHASGGQADKVPARLSGGEYIMDADIVSALGDGNTDAGAAKLDQMREAIRQHKRSGSNKKIPPAAKSPLEYMKGR